MDCRSIGIPRIYSLPRIAVDLLPSETLIAVVRICWCAAVDRGKRFPTLSPLGPQTGVADHRIWSLAGSDDTMAGLPGWGTLGESISTTLGGVLLVIMERRVSEVRGDRSRQEG